MPRLPWTDTIELLRDTSTEMRGVKIIVVEAPATAAIADLDVPTHV